MSRSSAGCGAKKPALTLAQLSSYDDMLTDALVDRAYYWTTIPKNRPSYHPSRGVKEEEITKIIQTHLIVNPDIDIAEQKLLATDGLRRFYNALKTPKEKVDFKQHMRRYTQIYLSDCPFEVSSTNRYTITTHEASIVARRFIKRNESIKYLSGIQVLITPEEEAALSVRKKDFSIVVSSRSRMASLFMGPARFANHDCGANAKLVITGQAGIDIVAVRSIGVGEEITVTYGENYFGEDNCECLCQTCEDTLANGWRQPGGVAPVKKSIELDGTAAQGYNTRGRRRYGRGESRSRTPSITPDLRPKVFKTRAKQLRDGDRASTAESSLPGFTGGGGSSSSSSSKRIRDSDSLATPPVTPAKKQKTTHYEIRPVSLRMERSVSSEDESRGIASRSESSAGEAVLTDVTTPEDTTDPAESITANPTPLSQAIENLKQEQDAEEATGAGLKRVALFSDSMELPSSSSPDPLSTGLVDFQTTPASPERRTRGRLRRRSLEGSPPRQDMSLPLTEVNRLPTPPAGPPGHRVPGDYELTPRLLSEPDMAWVRCMNCSVAFVQPNAYYTRSSCPRCERHSKLYGYVWPKTQREGPWDKEERILDHRTIHRFLALDDELQARGRAAIKRPETKTPKEDTPVSTSQGIRRGSLRSRNKSSARDRDRDNDSPSAESDVRRSGRSRKARASYVRGV
ncbi:hypothetical protein M406DRAFT_283848 [Cryphonectria parasitica EP155]|uniref:Histone-lysine N-methyltransferase SET9 n=1 Tax=Cryphonectria parasitica (strain ATCC 38755 / EP155) TaxID=660469 RepID=A0A9P4YB81_CRYP1|nr:uncharacterized protein M406DRAFT_283848 [Cryphonectria parasitica EP155]KAF3769455.1 hypothetical protein M406DRAFT_283848 [Cryphonectria parasitica EP155]